MLTITPFFMLFLLLYSFNILVTRYHLMHNTKPSKRQYLSNIFTQNCHSITWHQMAEVARDNDVISHMRAQGKSITHCNNHTEIGDSSGWISDRRFNWFGDSTTMAVESPNRTFRRFYWSQIILWHIHSGSTRRSCIVGISPCNNID